MPKYHKNKNGDTCYVFSWEGGGGNHVFADRKSVALRRAIAFGKGLRDRDGVKYDYETISRNKTKVTLVPIESTLRSVTTEEFLEFDRGLAMLAW